MTWWGCPACGNALGVRLLAGCPRCRPSGGPGLVSIVNHREFLRLTGKEAVLAYLAELAKEEDMPKTTVHSGSSNGPADEPTEPATGGVVEDVGLVAGSGPAPFIMPAKPAPADVRAWARANGVDVNPRGNIPAAVLEQYRQAVST